MWSSAQERTHWLAAWGGLTLYGLIMHFLAQRTWQIIGISALSLTFLIILPGVMGAATMLLANPTRRSQWWYAVCAPWIPCVLLGALVIALNWELTICVLIALPIFMSAATVGGLVMYVYYRGRSSSSLIDSATRSGVSPEGGRRDTNTLMALGVLLLLPQLSAPIEGLWQPVAIERSVESVVEIAAPLDAVWETFVAVPAIQTSETPFAWFPLLGLPRPVAAMVEGADDNGGVPTLRTATYANGLIVHEPITQWQPSSRYAFGVFVDEASLPHPLWGAVASNAFSAQEVAFELEPLSGPEGEGVRLRLTTHYRVETPVNAYATRWLDFLLRDFQRYILHVIKHRVEQAP